MSKESLSFRGHELANELEAASNTYHIKSSKHEILAYESIGVRGIAIELEKGSEFRYKLFSSCLLSDWGEPLAGEQPELFIKVKEFREDYERLKKDFNKM